MQDAELAVTLLYELGEGASEEAMKPRTGALAQLAQGEATDMSLVAQPMDMPLFRLLWASQWQALVHGICHILCHVSDRMIIHQRYCKAVEYAL